MVEYTHLQHQELEEEEEEEEEETLSLRDLPLDANEDNEDSGNHRRSSSPEFFEFFSNLTSHEMSSAEDIIFRGKLVPFKALSLPPPAQRHSSFRRRSESLSALQSSRSSSIMMRNSRSLDYRRLERFSSSKTTSVSEISIDRSSSARSIRRGEAAAVSRRTAKPRWRFLLFGIVKPPAEMELSDIKSRQYRRNSSAAIIPPPVNSKKSPVSKCSSYRLLKVLSCRDSTSVPVTASFCMPPAALQHV